MVADSRRWKAGLVPQRAAYGRRRELTLSAKSRRSRSPRNLPVSGRCADPTRHHPRRRTGASSRRPLRVGAAACPYARSVPTRVFPLWRRNADHRLHHRSVHHPRHPPPRRRADRATPHRAGLRPAVVGPARCQGGDCDPHAQPAPESSSINASLGNPDVDCRPRATPGRCVPAAAGARCEPPAARATPAFSAPRAPQRPVITPASRRPRQVGGVFRCLRRRDRGLGFTIPKRKDCCRRD